MTADQILVTRDEAARMLSLSVAEVDNERRAGRLIGRKHGRKVLIPVDELRRWAGELPADEAG
ncbi:HTH DNA binding protein [Mycobacterium phage Patt]|uniref:Excise n=1 Tax=Mycobacterium phage Patt TaxID=2530139 RepID=A0A481VR22_9CAUD|nr:HTH DNA binding protein [Mycobacterium phage Patt]QBI96027.1 excise [Mycobacterium phage MissDaisy]QBI96279.1 excise [Mycobacterium phage Patt]